MHACRRDSRYPLCKHWQPDMLLCASPFSPYWCTLGIISHLTGRAPSLSSAVQVNIHFHLALRWWTFRLFLVSCSSERGCSEYHLHPCMHICAKIIFQDGLAGSDGLCILTSDFNHCPGARVSCLPSAACWLEASAGHDDPGWSSLL